MYTHTHTYRQSNQFFKSDTDQSSCLFRQCSIKGYLAIMAHTMISLIYCVIRLDLLMFTTLQQLLILVISLVCA